MSLAFVKPRYLSDLFDTTEAAIDQMENTVNSLKNELKGDDGYLFAKFCQILMKEAREEKSLRELDKWRQDLVNYILSLEELERDEKLSEESSKLLKVANEILEHFAGISESHAVVHALMKDIFNQKSISSIAIPNFFKSIRDNYKEVKEDYENELAGL